MTYVLHLSEENFILTLWIKSGLYNSRFPTFLGRLTVRPPSYEVRLSWTPPFLTILFSTPRGRSSFPPIFPLVPSQAVPEKFPEYFYTELRFTSYPTLH